MVRVSDILWGMGYGLATKRRRRFRLCPHCGKRIPYDAFVCPYCGKEVGEPHPLDEFMTGERDYIECPVCWEEIPSDSRFCPYCGNEVKGGGGR